MYQKTLFFGVNVIYNKKREFFSTQNDGTYIIKSSFLCLKISNRKPNVTEICSCKIDLSTATRVSVIR